MGRKDLLKTIITDNQARELPTMWSREQKIPVATNKIVTVAGVRRSGKTYHIFNIMKQLMDLGVPSTNMLYLNFEDERLKLEKGELDLILQAFRELHPSQNLQDCYFFFDELQEVAGWEKFINRMYSTITKNIYITGSNSKLLSTEIATSLRGRTITYQVYPLSFREFVTITNPSPLNVYNSQDTAKLVALFNQFLYQGGFPEVVDKGKELREKILQEYFNVMLMKDLIERYKISQASIIKHFCKRVVAGSGGEFSVNKIYNELKSQGYKISKDSMYEYQDYVDNIYLARFIPKYTHSVVKSAMSQKKSYVIDQGFGVALDFKFTQDTGRLLETVIALELIKAGKQIAYDSNGSECDFVVIEKDQVTQAIQVTQELADEETKTREVKGLTTTCKKCNLPTGVIVTLDTSDEFVIDGVEVKVTPAWKYLFSTDV